MTKKLTIVVAALGASLCAAAFLLQKPEPVFNGDVPRVTAPENNEFTIGVKNYDSAFASDIANDRALEYRLGDKYIAFKPVGVRWAGSGFMKTTEHAARRGRASYEGVFGEGFDLNVGENDRIWSKILSIRSLADLGQIPPGVRNLEAVFAIDTNFVIDGWDRKSEFEVTGKVRIGDKSYLEPPMVWDSAQITDCIIAPCPPRRNAANIRSFFYEEGGQLFYRKVIPVEWLKSATFPVYTDADVTYGTAQNFATVGSASFAQVTSPTTDTFQVCITDGDAGGTNAGECFGASVADTTITYGASTSFVADAGNGEAGRRVTASCSTAIDRIMVIYADDDQLDDGYAVIASTSGNTILGYGAPVEFETGDMENPSCAKIADNKVAICYNDETNSDAATCAVLTVGGADGDTITAGTPVAITTSQKFEDGSVTALGLDKFMTCFQASDDSNDGHCYAATVAGTVPTFGADKEFETGFAAYNSLAKAGDDQFVLVGIDLGSFVGHMRVGTVSGTTITLGASASYGGSNPYADDVINLDPTRFLATVGGFSSQGRSYLLTADYGAVTVAAGTTDVYEADDIISGTGSYFGRHAVIINTNKVAICYEEVADSYNGKCIIGSVGALAVTNTAGVFDDFILITE